MVRRRWKLLLTFAMLTLIVGFALSRKDPGEARVYATRSGRELRLTIFRPKTGDGPFPGALLIHGGGWIGGSAEDMAEMGRGMANLGWVTASVEYRLAGKDRWPAQLEDCQDAMRYLRAHATELKILPKIAAIGGSAGGHLAICLGSMGEPGARADAIGDFYGPSDLRRTFPSTLDGLWQPLFGKPFAEATKEREAMSPILHIDKSTAPMFIIHGTADELVPTEQATILRDKLKETGIPCECRIIEGMKHGINAGDPKQMQAFLDMAAWLKTQLTKP